MAVARMANKYILTLNDPNEGSSVDSRVRHFFREADWKRAGSCTWFLKSDLLSQQISEQLFDEAKGQRHVSHVVCRIDAFWGYNDKSLWEWLSAP